MSNLESMLEERDFCKYEENDDVQKRANNLVVGEKLMRTWVRY